MTVVIEGDTMTIDAIPVSLTAADGYVLGGSRYPADAVSKGRLVVAGATAVPQGFYRRFAQFASARGFETLTFDYRGIGRSRPPSLNGFRTDLLDWARLDLAAAVDTMADGAVPLCVVGHSYGGHAFGLLPNHRKVAGFYVFGTGAGWHGYMPLGERLRVLAMWNTVLPVLTWWKGYCPWKMLGLGEDLPVDVYRQWRHWCRFPAISSTIPPCGDRADLCGSPDADRGRECAGRSLGHAGIPRRLHPGLPQCTADTERPGPKAGRRQGRTHGLLSAGHRAALGKHAGMVFKPSAGGRDPLSPSLRCIKAPPPALAASRADTRLDLAQPQRAGRLRKYPGPATASDEPRMTMIGTMPPTKRASTHATKRAPAPCAPTPYPGHRDSSG
ncbi:alpha/beta fold hydrolase [Ralstonia syzygii subsp. celebesensis]